jgi:hypothetical protein
LAGGNNCVSLVHLGIKLLYGVELPENLGCAELYQDTEFFKPVENIENIQVGDLTWFGIENPSVPPENIELVHRPNGELVNWRDFPVKHVGITYDIQEEPQILHATHFAGTNVVWGLSAFAQHRRYKKLYKVSRFKES